tara:strand:- start:948 stop:1088 length:141 start_codon:yes stop_codon:yes gene_type:complete
MALFDHSGRLKSYETNQFPQLESIIENKIINLLVVLLWTCGNASGF